MGLLTTIHAVENGSPDFIANNLEAIQSSPHEDCCGLNPMHFQRLHQILTGEDEATITAYYKEPLYVESEEGPWVLSLPNIFVGSLVGAPASLGPIALKWVATPEMQADRWQPPAALLLLSNLRNFLRKSVEAAQVPLLLISL